jgi:prepilin-type N-terminal cleavage/methylation domain-containing protein
VTARTAAGFTLVELSIVLVIVGLLAGGILVGRDMIHAAVVRAQVSQIERYNQAVLTFRLKFDALPGDLTDPAKFGLTASAALATGLSGFGNGNGVIDSDKMYTQPYYYCGYTGHDPAIRNQICEEPFFWLSLQDAGLLDQALPACDVGSLTMNAGGYFLNGCGLPRARIAGGGQSGYLYNNTFSQSGPLVSITNFGGVHYFRLVRMPRANATPCRTTGAGTEGTWCETLAPADAQAIDAKTDDGMPLSGRTLASQGYSWNDLNIPYLNTPTQGAAGGPTCTTNVAPYPYNVNAATPDLCSLNIRTAF